MTDEIHEVEIAQWAMTADGLLLQLDSYDDSEVVFLSDESIVILRSILLN